MPLFTYLVSYQGSLFVEQDQKSNFRGFVAHLLGQMPENALPNVTPALRKELTEALMRSEWQPVPNRTRVWRTSIELRGKPFVIHCVQTEK